MKSAMLKDFCRWISLNKKSVDEVVSTYSQRTNIGVYAPVDFVYSLFVEYYSHIESIGGYSEDSRFIRRNGVKFGTILVKKYKCKHLFRMD